MTSRSDFTPDEWNLIFQAPAFAALYIAQAGHYHPGVAYQKLMAGILAIIETAEPDTDSALVKAIRAAIVAGQRPYYPESFPADPAEARGMTLEGCRQAARLLAQRVPDSEASTFIAWLVAIGEAVAAVPDEPPWAGPEAAGGTAETALEELAATLKRA